MKKILFIVSAVAVLATGTVFGVKAYQNAQHPMTDLMRQNLEALTDSEYYGSQYCKYHTMGYCEGTGIVIKCTEQYTAEPCSSYACCSLYY